MVTVCLASVLGGLKWNRNDNERAYDLPIIVYSLC